MTNVQESLVTQMDQQVERILDNEIRTMSADLSPHKTLEKSIEVSNILGKGNLISSTSSEVSRLSKKNTNG